MYIALFSALHNQLANLGRLAQLTHGFSARSSATAEKQRVSCACLPIGWLDLSSSCYTLNY